MRRQPLARIQPTSVRRQLRDWRSAIRRDRAYYEKTERSTFLRRALGALAFNGISGDYAEFGCWSGVTFGLANQQIRLSGRPRHLWAFDSFRGLPSSAQPDDDHPVWQQGEYAMSVDEFRASCDVNGIPVSDYDVIEGFYSETLADQGSARLPSDIALAYIDCDLYSSTRDVLAFLATRLKHGMIVAFDDYFCYSENTLAGERKALLELAGEQNSAFHFSPYIQFGWHGMSFIVEDRVLLGELEAGVP